MARVLIISSQSCEGEVHFGGLLRAPLRRCWTLRPSRPPPAPVRPAQTTARHRCAPPRARRATATAPSSPSLPLRRPSRRRRGQSGEHTELIPATAVAAETRAARFPVTQRLPPPPVARAPAAPSLFSCRRRASLRPTLPGATHVGARSAARSFRFSSSPSTRSLCPTLISASRSRSAWA